MGYLARFACCTTMLLALGAPVFAEPTKADQARAAELKKEGDALVHASKFKEALEKYDASFGIVPNPAIHYNRGRALQNLGDYPAALDALDQFVATAPPDLRSKVPNLDKTMAEIAAHVATLVVRCEVPGASVSVRGKTLGTTPLKPFRTTPGDVSIEVTAPGYVVFTQDTSLTPGETTTVTAQLHKVAAEQAPNSPEPTPFDAEKPASPPPAAEHPSTKPNGWKMLGWTAGGVGVATLAVGGVFFGLSLADKSSADPHCPNKVCDPIGRQSINEAWTFADVSTVLVGVGVVALALSVTFFIIAPKTVPVQAGLLVGPGSVGIGGSF